ncbi:MAG: helix-turn-helix transcriptional regulator [Pseudomonadota bacterium]
MAKIAPLVTALAEAQGRPDAWPDVFETLGAELGGVGALLELFDDSGALGIVGPRSAFFDDSLMRSYLEDYHHLSPRPAVIARRDAPSIQYDAQLGSDAQLDKNPFYAEFLPRQGLRYFVSATLRFGDGLCGVVSVQRAPSAGHVDDQEIALLHALRAPLHAMIAPALPLLVNGARADALAAVLPELAPLGAVAALNGDVLAAGPEVYQLEGVVPIHGPHAAGFALSAPWQSAILAAGRQSKATGRSERVALTAANEADNTRETSGTWFADVRACSYPWHTDLAVLPATALGSPVLAISFVFEPPNLANLLRARYGLTARESDVLMALADGLTPEEIAARFDLSTLTVRSHLARLREKTGRQRATQLVHLVYATHRQLH